MPKSYFWTRYVSSMNVFLFFGSDQRVVYFFVLDEKFSNFVGKLTTSIMALFCTVSIIRHIAIFWPFLSIFQEMHENLIKLQNTLYYPLIKTTFFKIFDSITFGSRLKLSPFFSTILIKNAWFFEFFIEAPYGKFPVFFCWKNIH